MTKFVIFLVPDRNPQNQWHHPPGNDEINDALVVMAKVRAYFQVAYKVLLMKLTSK
jgi:hypothetical protein